MFFGWIADLSSFVVLRFPDFGKWGEDGVGSAIGFEDVLFFKDHLVLEGVEWNGFAFEKGGYFLVTGYGIRFIIMIGVYGCDLEIFGEFFKGGQRLIMKNQQGGSCLLQLALDICQGLVNKGDPFICLVFEGVEDDGVENEDGQYRSCLGQRLVEAVVVSETKVTAEPEDGDVIFCHSLFGNSAHN